MTMCACVGLQTIIGPYMLFSISPLTHSAPSSSTNLEWTGQVSDTSPHRYKWNSILNSEILSFFLSYSGNGHVSFSQPPVRHIQPQETASHAQQHVSHWIAAIADVLYICCRLYSAVTGSPVWARPQCHRKERRKRKRKRKRVCTTHV